MDQLRVGGVPEHFNYPWMQAMDNGAFKAAKLDIRWETFAGGTGAMNLALRENKCDVCLLLTEGIVKDIVQGNPSRIISGFVKSPLIWGIYTSPDSLAKHLDDITVRKIAISRHGSGSHLMPTVHSLIEGRSIAKNTFIEVGNLEGAIHSLRRHETNVFYWEKYTTKPYVDRKELKRIGEFITPWPCFMIVATERIIQDNPEALDRMLDVIHEQCERLMNDPDAPRHIGSAYDLRLQDAENWFHATEWNADSWVSDKMVRGVIHTLQEAGVIERAELPPLIWKRKV